MAKQELLPEYDFSNGVRGKYAKAYKEGTNIVVIEPDLLKEFPDSKAVNSALRKFLAVKELAKNSK